MAARKKEPTKVMRVPVALEEKIKALIVEHKIAIGDVIIEGVLSQNRADPMYESEIVTDNIKVLK